MAEPLSCLLDPRRWIDRQSIDPWYWGYCFQGAVILGLVPILLPIVVAKTGGAAAAGLVVAGFYSGQMLSPAFGALADRTGRYAALYLGGYVLIGIGCAAFPWAGATWMQFLLAFLQGAGAGASNTVTAMYIIEFRPKEQWDARIGWLQTLYGTGQAIGLAAVAVLQQWPMWGLLAAAALMLPGVLLGRVGLPRRREHHEAPQCGTVSPEHPDLPHHHRPLGRSVLAPLHFYQQITGEFGTLGRAMLSRFGLMIVSWFFALFGQMAVMNLLPLMFEDLYGIDAGLSSLDFAIFAVVGIFFYAPSGTWARRFGDARVLAVGVTMLWLSLVGLTATAYVPSPEWRFWLAMAAFAPIPVSWSPLIVAATALTGRLTTIGQGAGMGVFNATTAIAAVASAAIGGHIAEQFGYTQVAWLAVATASVGIVLLMPLLRRRS